MVAMVCLSTNLVLAAVVTKDLATAGVRLWVVEAFLGQIEAVAHRAATDAGTATSPRVVWL
jgi:hypothetical protein